jgi:hypothetical protein
MKHGSPAAFSVMEKFFTTLAFVLHLLFSLLIPPDDTGELCQDLADNTLVNHSPKTGSLDFASLGFGTG